jgi:RHS repeat-associated protein
MNKHAGTGKHYFYHAERLHTLLSHETTRVVWAQDKVVAQTSDATQSTQLLQSEQNGSVLGTASSAPDAERARYDAYGYCPTERLPSLIGFMGEFTDPILGFQPLGQGHRMYWPGSRRFSSTDSLSPFHKGGLNAYAYCAGDPINNHDPSGGFRIPLLSSFFRPAARAFVRFNTHGAFSRPSKPQLPLRRQVTSSSTLSNAMPSNASGLPDAPSRYLGSSVPHDAQAPIAARPLRNGSSQSLSPSTKLSRPDDVSGIRVHGAPEARSNGNIYRSIGDNSGSNPFGTIMGIVFSAPIIGVLIWMLVKNKKTRN